MRSRKVIIADPNEEFSLALAEALSSDFQVECFHDGERALSRIRQWKPDILVSELILENMDGIELLHQLGSLYHPPKVMVVSSFFSGYIQHTLEQLDVQYAMVKSCPVSAAARRVREIAHTISPVSELPLQYIHYATEILMELQLPNGRQGFLYLQAALPLLMLQRDRRLSKELYAEIAKLHNSTSVRVEKAIRDTLHAGWAAGCRAAWRQYFPDAARCPRNKDFLFRITDILSQRIRQETPCELPLSRTG